MMVACYTTLLPGVAFTSAANRPIQRLNNRRMSRPVCAHTMTPGERPWIAGGALAIRTRLTYYLQAADWRLQMASLPTDP